MNYYLLFIATLTIPFYPSNVSAQDDVRVLHRGLKTEIEKSWKAKSITEVEYKKMLEEHQIIAKSIEKAMIDGHLAPDEKNKILGKINRSKKRLIRYKHNSEVY
jgi:hypothetical protein